MKIFIASFYYLLLYAQSYSKNIDYRIDVFLEKLSKSQCVAIISDKSIHFIKSDKVPDYIKIPKNLMENVSSLFVCQQSERGSSVDHFFPVIRDHAVINANSGSESFILVEIGILSKFVKNLVQKEKITFEHISHAEASDLFRTRELPKRLRVAGK